MQLNPSTWSRKLFYEFMYSKNDNLFQKPSFLTILKRIHKPNAVTLEVALLRLHRFVLNHSLLYILCAIAPSVTLADTATLEVFPEMIIRPSGPPIGLLVINISGELTDATPGMLERALKGKTIEAGEVYLSSKGGSLMSALAIGRIIRKHQLNTYVGKFRPSEGIRQIPALPADCASACVLAFLGGTNRHMVPKSRIGVHQFSSPTTSPLDLATAQIVSAHITKYLAEMGVSISLFEEMSQTLPAEVNWLSPQKLSALGVTTGHPETAVWTIEVIPESFYLRGEQKTARGLEKVILSCRQNSSGLSLLGMVPVGKHSGELLNSVQTVSLRLGEGQPGFTSVDPADFELFEHNGYINSAMNIKKERLSQLLSASYIGVALHLLNPDFFIGVLIDTSTGKEKIKNFVNHCAKTQNAGSSGSEAEIPNRQTP